MSRYRPTIGGRNPIYGHIDRTMDKINRGVLLVQKKLAFEILRRVISKSPVDTGRYRGNWQLGVGSRPTGTITPVRLSVPRGKDEPFRAPNPASAGDLADANSKLAAMQKPELVNIVNNLPYAQPIEDGHSQQAPAGVLAVTLAEIRAEAPALVKQFVRGLK